MNDSELIMAVRESVADVRTATPVEQILNRGRAVRARRRIAGLAAALACAAGAAVAVTALLPAGHPAGHRSGDQLAAWTVVKRPGGTVAVTIHELYYPAGLQGKLRADGVPASVAFDAVHRYPPGCRAYPASRALLATVFPPHPGAPTAAIVIRPSALPPGTGVYIDDFSDPYGYVGLHTGLVYAGQRCTGG